MTKLDAKNMPAKELCARIRESTDTALAVEHVNGQRYIAAGLGKKELTLTGTPGNALGAYLNGTRITVLGNAQDATGDTMNDGAIFVHGSSGDATGYAMRGGKIYVRGNAGYRAGIHMKAYREKQPVLIIGGEAGSFLGEYQPAALLSCWGWAAAAERRWAVLWAQACMGAECCCAATRCPRTFPPKWRPAGPGRMTWRPWSRIWRNTAACSGWRRRIS